jgi:IS5 family transposase
MKQQKKKKKKKEGILVCLGGALSCFFCGLLGLLTYACCFFCHKKQKEAQRKKHTPKRRMNAEGRVRRSLANEHAARIKQVEALDMELVTLSNERSILMEKGEIIKASEIEDQVTKAEKKKAELQEAIKVYTDAKVREKERAQKGEKRKQEKRRMMRTRAQEQKKRRKTQKLLPISSTVPTSSSSSSSSSEPEEEEEEEEEEKDACCVCGVDATGKSCRQCRECFCDEHKDHHHCQCARGQKKSKAIHKCKEHHCAKHVCQTCKGGDTEKRGVYCKEHAGQTHTHNGSKAVSSQKRTSSKQTGT